MFLVPPLEATVNPVQTTVILYEMATMSCYLTLVNEGNPSAWFDWTRQWDNSWSEEGTDGNISFNVTEPDMDDSYTCLPENIHGIGQGATVNLTVAGVLSSYCNVSTNYLNN